MGTHSREALRDLMLMGLTWLQDEWRGPLGGWKANGLFRTYQQLGVLSDAQYYHIASGTDKEFERLLVSQTKPMAGPRTQRSVVREAMANSDKLFIAVVSTMLFNGDMLFTPRGYLLFATERGEQHANRVKERYAHYLTRESFWAQWRRHAKHMRGMHYYTREDR